MDSSAFVGAVLLGVVLLFWAVGAYNRLVRLRAAVQKSFAALDAQLVRELVWVQSCLPQSMRGGGVGGGITTPAELQDEDSAVWLRLWGASEQLAAALAAAREQPLSPDRMDGLATAHDTLDTAWTHARDSLDVAPAAQADAAAPARAVGTGALDTQRVRLLHHAAPLREAFNNAVFAYNRAIAQFPAALLARAVGFRPAGTLRRLAAA